MGAVLRRARPILGTVVAIEIDQSRSTVDHGASIEAAFDAVARVHRSMSFHSVTSDLSRLNGAKVGEIVSVDPWFVEVIRVALEMYRLSEGVFDPGIAPALIRNGQLPGAEGEGIQQESSVGAIELVDNRRLVKRGGARLDLGGIAKGFAVDMAVQALEAAGIEDGAVNAGGDLRVFGSRGRLVVIRHPIEPGRLSGSFELQAMACCSSVSDGVSPNCVDPRSGASFRQTIGATVVAPKAVWADGLTKVAIVEGALSVELQRRFSAQLIHHEVFEARRGEWSEGERACA